MSSERDNSAQEQDDKAILDELKEIKTSDIEIWIDMMFDDKQLYPDNADEIDHYINLYIRVISDRKRANCQGCKNNCLNQQAHMAFGGCLYYEEDDVFRLTSIPSKDCTTDTK